MNINPIPHSTLFDTPTSFHDLHDWCVRHSGSERIVALVAANMAINLCHKIVNDQIEKNEVLK